MKKLLSIVLSIAMLITMVSVMAITASADDELKWDLTSDNFSLINKTLNGDFSELYGSAGTHFIAGSASSTVAPGSVTFVSSFTVDPGVYSTAIYGRTQKDPEHTNQNPRALLDFDINGTTVATGIDMRKAAFNANEKYDMGSVTITTTSTINLTVTTTTTGNVYLNALEMVKTADVTSSLLPAPESPWELYSNNFLLSDNTTGGTFNTYNQSPASSWGGGTRFATLSGAAAENSAVTFTSNFAVEPGEYNTALYARVSSSGRATVNIDINGTRVATGLDMNESAFAANFKYDMGKITINESTSIAVTFTVTGSGSLYLNSLEFTEDVPPVTDPYEDIAGTTNVAAQLRIGNVNGIRFITEVDTDLIAAAKAEGYTVAMGTLIAPLSYGTLTTATDPVINIATPGYYKEQAGKIAASIVNIKPQNISKDFVARGYLTLTKDETTTVYYATQPNEGRSLKTLSAAALADEDLLPQLTPAQIAQITEWAND